MDTTLGEQVPLEPGFAYIHQAQQRPSMEKGHVESQQ